MVRMSRGRSHVSLRRLVCQPSFLRARFRRSPRVHVPITRVRSSASLLHDADRLVEPLQPSLGDVLGGSGCLMIGSSSLLLAHRDSSYHNLVTPRTVNILRNKTTPSSRLSTLLAPRMRLRRDSIRPIQPGIVITYASSTALHTYPVFRFACGVPETHRAEPSQQQWSGFGDSTGRWRYAMAEPKHCANRKGAARNAGE